MKPTADDDLGHERERERDRDRDRDHDRERDDDGADAPLTLAAVLKAARAELNLEQPPAFRLAPIETTGGDTSVGVAAAGQRLAPGLPTRRDANNPGRAVQPAISACPRRWAWGLVACLGVMLLSLVLLLLMPAALPPGQRGIDAQAATITPSGFLPLVPAAQLAAASRQPSAAWLIAADMPRDRLAALGLPFDPSRAGENVRTELLVNPAGEVLALRLLH